MNRLLQWLAWGLFGLLVLLFLFTGAMVAIFGTGTPANQEPVKLRDDSGLQPVRLANLNPVDQTNRLAVIQTGLNNGVLLSIKWNTSPEVMVGREFYLLTFDQRQKLASIIWAASKFDHTKEIVMVRLRDGYSGKEIGEFPSWTGELKMY